VRFGKDRLRALDGRRRERLLLCRFRTHDGRSGGEQGGGHHGRELHHSFLTRVRALWFL